MNLFTYLSGRSADEVWSFIFSAANITLNTTFCVLVGYLPLKSFLRVRPRTVVLSNIGLMTANLIVFMFVPELLADTGTGQIFGLYFFFLTFMPLAIYFLRDCLFQNLFILAFAQCTTQFVMGIANWIEFRFGDYFFGDIQYGLSFISKVFMIPIAVIFCNVILTRLFAAWGGGKNTRSFWHALWMIPTTLCVLTAISGTVYTLNDKTSLSFLLSRVFSFIALIVCVTLMTEIMNRERETAAARIRTDLLQTADKAFVANGADTRMILEMIDTDNEETIQTVKRIRDCAIEHRHDEIAVLLKDRIAMLDTVTVERFCENEAVNALIIYYTGIADREGIDVTCRLDIPRKAGRITNIDLARIIGNMLENAVEACRLMNYGAKKIRLQSKISGDMLVIGMNNSFDGEVKKNATGSFLSRKRESGIATGLDSIRYAAEKYDGSVKFETDDRIFKTSVRLDMIGSIT
jgi:signal transduction histidine kinase